MAKQPIKTFTWVDYLLRFAAPLLLVLITYNPTGFSFYTWLREALAGGEMAGIHFLALTLLIIGWSILLVATWRALDTFGIMLTCALLAAIVWVLIDWGLLSTDSPSAITWIVLVCLAAVLAIGLSWAHVWRRMTGQYTVDEIDD